MQQVPERSNRLYIGIELAKNAWTLAVSDGDEIEVQTIDAKDYQEFANLIQWARERFKLDDELDLFSCYEAGQDGFAPHRNLAERGINNLVVDPGSVESSAKDDPKTDRLDARTLVRKLIHYHAGDKEVFSTVRVPNKRREDDREISRELETLKTEKNRHENRIRSLLFKHGIDRKPSQTLIEQLDEVTTSYGDGLGQHLKDRIRREYERLQQVTDQLKEVKRKRRKVVNERKDSDPAMRKIEKMMQLKGVGPETAFTLVTEAFGWREFQNREEVGGYLGLTPTPHNTGDEQREKGMSKSGPGQLRKMAIEIAWKWLENQPRSELTNWFYDRWDGDSKRMKRILIVALARKLMVRIWKYLENDVPPNGSKLGAKYVNWY